MTLVILKADTIYKLIVKGMTDSEHIFALFVEIWQSYTESSLVSALQMTLTELTDLAQKYDTSLSANIIVSDGDTVAAVRYSYQTPAPTLYWYCDAVDRPSQIIIASEPLSKNNWVAFSEQSTLSVEGESLLPKISLLPKYS